MCSKDYDDNNMMGYKTFFNTSAKELAFENDALRLRINRLGTNYVKEIQLKDKTIEDLKQKGAALEEQIEAAIENIKKLKKKKASLKAKAEDTREKLQILEDKNEIDTEKIRSLKTELLELNKKNDMLIKENQTNVSIKEELETQFRDLQTKLSSSLVEHNEEMKKVVTKLTEQEELSAKRDKDVKEMIAKGQDENSKTLAQMQEENIKALAKMQQESNKALLQVEMMIEKKLALNSKVENGSENINAQETADKTVASTNKNVHRPKTVTIEFESTNTKISAMKSYE